MKIKGYNQFIIESNTVNEGYDTFDEVLNLPLSQRKGILDALEDLYHVKEDSVNEELNIGKSIKDFYNSIVNRLKKWLGKKAVSYLINLSQRDLDRKIDMLKMLDPTDFSDIDKSEVIYLGGGIDKTTEEGATGWRDMIEDYFGMDHVVRGDDMIKLAKKGKLDKSKYPKPLIMNPMRNELVRTDDPKFSEIFRKWKAGELDKEKDHEEWKYWANVINKEIHAPDLRIVNACDTNLVKLDPAAGAGTLGEMQISALRGLNLFVWLDNGYTVKDISPWLIPTVTKLVRNDEELSILLDNIARINKGDHAPEGYEERETEFPQSVVAESKLKRYNDFITEESWASGDDYSTWDTEDLQHYLSQLDERTDDFFGDDEAPNYGDQGYQHLAEERDEVRKELENRGIYG